MSEFKKTYEGGLFFLTCTVIDWLDVFTRSEYSDILVNNLKYCQEQKGLELFSYVIMPNHFHMVASRTTGEMSHLLRDLKSYTAKQVIQMIEENPRESRKKWLLQQFRFYAKFKQTHKEYTFWQSSNYPVDITDARIVKQKIEYIHQNPVRAGYVDEPEHWRYSSAYPLSTLRVLEI